MNLKLELSKIREHGQPMQIARYIGNDPSLFAELMDVFFGIDKRSTQNAAHIMSYCVDAFNELVAPYLPQLIENLTKNPNTAIKRNTVRILQNQIIPKDHQGLLYDTCFGYLTSAKEPIAVKAFSMTVLANLSKIYPELSNELIPIIEELVAHGSAGIKSRGKKVLVQLHKANSLL